MVGLPVTEAKQGLESVKSGLFFEKHKDDLFWFSCDRNISKAKKPQYKKEILITPHFFSKQTEKQKQLYAKAAKQFGKFMQKQIKLL